MSEPWDDKIARLEAELKSVEGESCRNAAELSLREDRAASLRRAIAALRAGHYVARQWL